MNQFVNQFVNHSEQKTMSVKKMVIVPYQILETMKWWKHKQYQKPILPPNPQAVDASHLLKDMGQILHRPDLSEAEKGSKVW